MIYRVLTKRLILISLVFSGGHQLFAQSNPDSILQGDIDTVAISSVLKSHHAPEIVTVGEALRYSPGLFLRTSSAGGMQLLSAKGLNPQHVQLLWNGVAIHSGMLGVSDLSLFSVGYQQQVTYQSQSQVQTIGGIAGVVNVKTLSPGSGIKTSFRQAIGSFGQLLSSLEHSGSKSAHQWAINVAYQKAENDFKYVDYTVMPSVEKKQSHGGFKRLNIYPYWKFTSKSGLEMEWMNETVFNKREIPPTLVSPMFKALQDDFSSRNTLRLRKDIGRVQHEFQAAYIYNHWYYHDIILQREYENTEQFIFARYHGKWKISPKWNAFYGSDVKQTWVKADKYIQSNVQETGWDAHIGMNWQPSLYFKIMAISKLSVRTNMPWYAPVSIEISGRPDKKRALKLYASAGTDIRYPTLNDRFWLPGGNENLKAEQSIGTSLGAEYAIRIGKNIEWEQKTELFFTQISEMILWLPTNKFYWSPQNIGQVRALGGQHEQRLSGIFKDHSFDIIASYSLNKSGSTKAITATDKTVGWQLPYFPIHSFKAMFNYEWKGWSASMDAQMYSERFVTRDGGQSIDPYSLFNINVGYKTPIKKWSIESRLSLNNLLDKYYEEIIYRPMPGRNFLLSFIIHWNHVQN